MGGQNADNKKNAINRLVAQVSKFNTPEAKACLEAIAKHRKNTLPQALDMVVVWMQSEHGPSHEQMEKIMELVKAAEAADRASKNVLPPWG